MKLNNQQIKDLYEAHTRLLDGRPKQALVDGKQQVIFEPYTLSSKARWNAAKNRAILGRLKEVIDEEFNTTVRNLRTFRALLPHGNPNPDLGKEHIDFLARENQAKLEAETDRVNAEFDKMLQQENDVVGLLKIPAAGLGDLQKNAYGSFLDLLMPFIEGEPDFGDKPAKAAE